MNKRVKKHNEYANVVLNRNGKNVSIHIYAISMG